MVNFQIFPTVIGCPPLKSYICPYYQEYIIDKSMQRV